MSAMPAGVVLTTHRRGTHAYRPGVPVDAANLVYARRGFAILSVRGLRLEYMERENPSAGHRSAALPTTAIVT